MRGKRAIVLKERERKKLQEISKAKGEKPRTKTRATIVLLSDAQMSGDAIGKILGLSRQTVAKTRTRWKRYGCNGLTDKKRSGRPPVVTEEYRKKLVDTVERDPKEYGYAFRRWTVPRLAQYMRIKTGIKISDRWLIELLHREGFVWGRTKQTIRNLQDKEEVKRAKKHIERLKKGL